MKRIIVVIATVIGLYGLSSDCFAQHKHHEKKSTSKVESSSDSVSAPVVKDAKTAAVIKEITASYLKLKNALVGEKTKEAATAGSALVSAFKGVSKNDLSAPQKKVYDDVEDDATEHAEHIGANSGNIAHQREHFDLLSNDIYDLVKAFGTDRVLYKDFCPMYNNKKGAIWLSEKKEIKNPYYGNKMLNCGSVKEELK